MKMYKRIFGVLLCLCMLLGAVSLAGAEEDTTGSHSHKLCVGLGDNCTDPAHSGGNHGSVTFATELSQKNGKLYIGEEECKYDGVWEVYTIPAGNYYLGTNLALDHGIQIRDSNGGNAILCLNGKTISCTKGKTIQIKSVNNKDITFTLCDCKSNGMITHTESSTYGNGVDVVYSNVDGNTDKANFIMYNGHITQNKGSGVYLNANTSFTMYGGSITQNGYNDTSNVSGGGAYVHNGATFTMYGGTIADNDASMNGGGVYVSSGGTFTVYGGSITGNHTAGRGGGIYSNSENISIYGGSVTNNSVNSEKNKWIPEKAGGIYVPASGTLTVGGNVNISGNWQGNDKESGNNSNVYLDKNSSGASATIVIEKALTGSPIGVTTATSVATENTSVKIATGKGAYKITGEDIGHFTPDAGTTHCKVEQKTDGLYLTHVHSGGTATCTTKATCTGCGEQYGNTLDHIWDTGTITTQPTCEGKGEKTFKCTQEGCNVTKTAEIPANGHNFENSTIYRYDGDQHWKKCANCNAEDTANKENHTGGTANCIEKAVCTSCNQEYGGLNSSNHKSDVGLWKGDNGVDGQHWKEYLCCHVRVSVGTHQWDVGVEVTPATCTTIGRKTFTCIVCGQKRDGEITALDHDLVPHEAKAATCTEIGWEAYNTCKREGCGYTTYKEIGKLDHDFKNGDYLSNDTQHWKQCKNCTATDTPADHTVVTDAAKPATTTETGLTEGKHCSVCGKVLVAQEVTPKLPRYYYNSTTTTTKDTTRKDTTKSPGTFDPGVGVYALTAVLSVTGMAWMGRKKH